MLRRHLKRSRCEGDNFSVICGIIHSEKAPEEDSVKNEAPAERKSALLPIIAAGSFLIAAVLVFAYLTGRADRHGGNAGTEQTMTADESGGGSEEGTDETEKSTGTEEDTGGTEEENTMESVTVESPVLLLK